MKRSTVAALVLLVGVFAGSARAFRVIEEVENSVELPLRALTLPTAVGDTVAYRACETCTRASHVVTEETTYWLNGQSMALADFLPAIELIRATPSVEARSLAGVFFDLNTERATRVIVVSRTR